MTDLAVIEFSTGNNSRFDPVLLAGVDLAWQSKRNPTAIAVGTLKANDLILKEIHQCLLTIESVVECLEDLDGLRGVAIDAPLIIKNEQGQRVCERDLGREYSSRHASCHTSNLKL
ncbi:MAG TPA: hypothetical protein DEO66_11460 [Marinobacter adhaerens]|nr:hypothetical protein [Marinobacter adhaerens]